MFLSGNELETGGCRNPSRGGPLRHVGTYARFLQPDPLGYEPGMNLYGYVDGDPVNIVDPSGLTPTQRICTGTKICPQHDSGGSGGSGSGMFGASGVSYGGHFARAGAGGPAQGTNESIEITSAYLWVKDSFAFNLVGGYMGNVVGPAAEKAWERFRKGVNDARCEVGKAGVLVEETGSQVTDAGGRVFIVGAAIGVTGVVTAQPEIAAVGGAVAAEGGVIMAVGGVGSLMGAGMRAIGGDYGALVGRSAVRTAGRAIPNPTARSVSTNTANQAAAPAAGGIPTCG